MTVKPGSPARLNPEAPCSDQTCMDSVDISPVGIFDLLASLPASESDQPYSGNVQVLRKLFRE